MKTLLIPVLFVLALALSSCGEKCTTCSITALGSTTEQAEFCGSKSEIDDYKDALDVTADLAGGTASCVDD